MEPLYDTTYLLQSLRKVGQALSKLDPEILGLLRLALPHEILSAGGELTLKNQMAQSRVAEALYHHVGKKR